MPTSKLKRGLGGPRRNVLLLLGDVRPSRTERHEDTIYEESLRRLSYIVSSCLTEPARTMRPTR